MNSIERQLSVFCRAASQSKEEWWDALTLDQQKAYKKEHPKSSKKLVTHEHKHKHHTKEAARAEEIYHFNIDKWEKSNNPEQRKKLESKIDKAEEDMLKHRYHAKAHKEKIDSKADSEETPVYGDEEDGSNSNADEKVIEEKLAPEKEEEEEDKEDEDKGKIPAKPESPHEKKITRSFNKVRRFFTRPQSINPIVKSTMKSIGNDPDNLKTLELARQHAKHDHRLPPKALIKKLGKIAAIALATAITASVIGAVPTLVLAHYINEHTGHGQALGQVAWNSIKTLKKSDDDSEEDDANEKTVKAMIRHLQEELKKSDDEDKSHRIEGVLDALRDSLEHYTLYEKEDAQPSNSRSHRIRHHRH